jgi:hypothetical protein
MLGYKTLTSHLVPRLRATVALLALCGAAAGIGCTGGTFDTTEAQRTDARRSAGNTIVGVKCDDRYTCPKDSVGAPTRCATALPLDIVGFCSPSCKVDADCDSAIPGLSLCTSMNGAANECLLFCDRQHINTSKECPDNWTCEKVQSYYLCVPKQERLPAPDM